MQYSTYLYTFKLPWDLPFFSLTPSSPLLELHLGSGMVYPLTSSSAS